MSITETAKDAGGCMLGAMLMLGMASLGIAALYGAAELSVFVLEWTPPILAIAFWVTILVLIPLALIPATRGFASGGIIISSYVFGAILWIISMAFTYDVWGLIAVIIGLVFFGVGVVAVAIVAALINGLWSMLGGLAFLLVLTYTSRVLGFWLAEKAEARAHALAEDARRADMAEPARPIRSNLYK